MKVSLKHEEHYIDVLKTNEKYGAQFNFAQSRSGSISVQMLRTTEFYLLPLVPAHKAKQSPSTRQALA